MEIIAVILVNNSLSDQMFAEILEGLANIRSLRGITYAQNDFGEKSCTKLISMLQKLTHIRLIDIKWSSIFINKLLIELLDDRSSIQRLWLSKLKN